MKLDDFLKCKKVRLLTDGYTNLNKGSEYNLVRLEVVISNNAGIEGRYPLDSFEPVIDQLENPLQNIELTPEFGSVEPKFKVGDRVYTGIDEDIKVIKQVKEKFVVAPSIPFLDTHYPISEVCHATPENYEMLCKLYPHIKFEQPPKPLTGSDLARAMLDKGWKYVPCYISDSSDTHALERQTRNAAVIIGTHKDHPSFFIYGSGKSFIYYAVPFDPRTGEPLTESVLND